MKYELTTESPMSHYGIPVLRLDGEIDLGPADIMPYPCDDLTAAEWLIMMAEELLTDDFEGVRSFCAQNPQGPQLSEPPTFEKRKAKMNIGQQLLNSARKSDELLDLTSHFWGSKLDYTPGVCCEIVDYVPKFGGMKGNRRKISAREIAKCLTLEQLEHLLKPVNDFATGDPQHYATADVQSVPLSVSLIAP